MGGQPSLQTSVGEKSLRVPAVFFGHLREQESPMSSTGDDGTVHPYFDLTHILQRGEARENRDLDLDGEKFLKAYRGKSRILLGGGHRHLLDRLKEGAAGDQVADATPKLALTMKGHEGAS